MPTFDLATAAATTRHTSAEPPIPHDHVRGANYAGGPVAMSLRGSRRELEADRLAARIVQSGGSDTAVRVMRESSDTLAGRTAPNYVADAITSPGAPLADETRRTMEAGFAINQEISRAIVLSPTNWCMCCSSETHCCRYNVRRTSLRRSTQNLSWVSACAGLALRMVMPSRFMMRTSRRRKGARRISHCARRPSALKARR